MKCVTKRATFNMSFSEYENSQLALKTNRVAKLNKEIVEEVNNVQDLPEQAPVNGQDDQDKDDEDQAKGEQNKEDINKVNQKQQDQDQAVIKETVQVHLLSPVTDDEKYKYRKRSNILVVAPEEIAAPQLNIDAIMSDSDYSEDLEQLVNDYEEYEPFELDADDSGISDYDEHWATTRYQQIAYRISWRNNFRNFQRYFTGFYNATRRIIINY